LKLAASNEDNHCDDGIEFFRCFCFGVHKIFHPINK
jgi:hypothetical protein